MRLLITGGAGYLGSVLVRKALDLGHRVDVVDNLCFGQGPTQLGVVSHPKYSFHVGDVRKRGSWARLVIKADVVIPLAALVGAPLCEQHQTAAEEVNCGAIVALMSSLSKTQRVIFPNTNSGYGTVPSGICTEETPLAPISVYGRTKLAAEQAVLGHENSVVLRLATVFGVSPRMRLDLLVNQLVRQAILKGVIEIFDPTLRRNFVHINDVADCFLACAESLGHLRGVYNLGLDSANMDKASLAKLVARATGAGIKVGRGHDPDRRDYLVSSEKLATAGFTARVDLTHGIRELIDAQPLLMAGCSSMYNPLAYSSSGLASFQS